jgi:hypothetical protein
VQEVRGLSRPGVVVCWSEVWKGIEDPKYDKDPQ